MFSLKNQALQLVKENKEKLCNNLWINKTKMLSTRHSYGNYYSISSFARVGPRFTMVFIKLERAKKQVKKQN